MKSVFTFMLCLWVGVMLAHQVTVHGIVRDNQIGGVLSNVTVMLDGSNYFAETNEKGEFEMVIPSGSYVLTAQKDGFSTRKINIVADDEPLELAIILQVLPINIAELVVRSDRPISAASSRLLNALDFELRPRNSAQDMLRLAPGLFIAQHAGGGKAEQIFVRGFDCDHGTDIAGSVDGIAANMVSHGHGQGYMDLHFIIPETVRSMEVFKGPYFTEFGDFATAAAVRFNTFDELPNNLVQFEVGSTPTQRTYTSGRTLVMYQLPVHHTRVSSYFAADLLQAPNYFERDQRFIRNNVFSKTTFKLTALSAVSVQVSGFGSTWEASGQIPERAVNQGLITRFGAIDPTEGGATQRRNIAASYRYADETTTFDVTAFQSQYRFKLFSNFTFFFDDAVVGDGIEQVDDRNIMGLNGKYSRRHKFGKTTFGGGYRADNIENGLYHQQARTRLLVQNHAKIQQQSVSVFVKNEWQITKRLRAELGLRSDYFIFDVDDVLAAIDLTKANISGTNYQTLLSPKLNLGYDMNQVKLFANAGRGFHSNDARTVVLDKNTHRLPSAWGAELGAQWKHRGVVFSSALWWMDLENELVYIGDAGETEDKGASRRVGIDLSARAQMLKSLYFDADINVSRSNFIDISTESGNLVPLAPRFTLTSGLTWKTQKGFDTALRVRHLAARPANEDNSISARGYTIADASMMYQFRAYHIGINIENLLNTAWNEAQFATESRLQDEAAPVEEIHFTPGTPFNLKMVVGYKF